MSMANDLKEIIKFRDDRNWKQFHSPKNLAISLALEAAEILEFFQWEKSEYPKEKPGDILEHELADMYYYLILLAHEIGCNLQGAFKEKMHINAVKYPIDKVRGNSIKYTKL